MRKSNSVSLAEAQRRREVKIIFSCKFKCVNQNLYLSQRRKDAGRSKAFFKLSGSGLYFIPLVWGSVFASFFSVVRQILTRVVRMNSHLHSIFFWFPCVLCELCEKIGFYNRAGGGAPTKTNVIDRLSWVKRRMT